MTTVDPNISTKRLNVLVYSGVQTYSDWKKNVLTESPGNGTAPDGVRQCLFTLRQLLSSNYAVIPVTAEMILNEPWTAGCALFVMPGGADLPYCRTLNGDGNRRISQYVQQGGAYLGFCAGAYYGSKRCEFEVGNKDLEVVGDRELAFFPGISRGCAFPGFVYNSKAGARAAELDVSKTALTTGTVPEIFKSYYNGGGVFVDAPKYADRGVEVLANYTESLHVDPGEGKAAVVYCRVGEGAAVLSAVHPEYAPSNLDPEARPGFSDIVDKLDKDNKARKDFLRACVAKLGLRADQESEIVPSLSSIHISAKESSDASALFSSLQDIITADGSEEYLADDNDKFRIENRSSSFGMHDLASAVPGSSQGEVYKAARTEDTIPNYDTEVKHLILQENTPEPKETPYFNHEHYYASLKEYQSQSKEQLHNFGSPLMYGEVVTSTNTLLEKNTRLLQKLPTGFTATATVQVAGRGRGSNVWVSPAGQLMFSVSIRHPMDKMSTAPVVFIQYLAALAIVRGIKTYAKGYDQMPVKMKWPNDIYALDPSQPDGKTYTKISGILVNAHFSSREYIAVVGMGVNTLNLSPTTSLNALLSTLPESVRKNSPLSIEKLLARIVTVFDSFYARFLRTGFDREFEDMYYADWLHMDQIVTLEAEGGVRARIKGITRDYGLLIAEELGWEDRPTGKTWQLQSDSNSFDFFKGLVKRKV